MTIHTIPVLYCDGAEDLCPMGGCQWDHSQVTVGELREMMRKTGWKSRDGLDFCPECVALGLHKPVKTA